MFQPRYSSVVADVDVRVTPKPLESPCTWLLREPLVTRVGFWLPEMATYVPLVPDAPLREVELAVGVSKEEVDSSQNRMLEMALGQSVPVQPVR